MISNYIIVIFIAFLFNALVCILFKKIGFVDKPDGIRKIHKGEISLGGGLSLFLASLIIFFFPIEILSNKESLLSTGLLEVWFISLIILILGLLDDVNPLPTSVRLIIQILASWLVIIFTDIYVRDLGDLLGLGNFYLGQLGIPITIFMVVGMCNAFNMIDGMDGFVGIVTLAIVLAVPFITSMNGFSGILFIPSILLFCF